MTSALSRLSLTSKPDLSMNHGTPHEKGQGESASSKAFATTELLEEILTNLEIRELLVNAQRVDRTWQATIKGSKKLQQALFFEPVPLTSIHPSRLRPVEDSSLTSNLARLPEYAANGGMPEFVLKSNILRNPLLRHACEALIEENRLRERLDAGSAGHRPPASWRHMFATQPPVQFSIGGKSIVKLGDVGNCCWTIWRSILPSIYVCPLAWCARQVQHVLHSEGDGEG